MPLLDPPLATDHLHITPWDDPVIERIGHDPRSAYAERFWLPALGPTTSMLLRRLAAELDDSPGGVDIEVGDLAAAIGLGGRAGRTGPFHRAFGRATQFKLTMPLAPDVVAVRRVLPPLTQYQVNRLPARLRDEHARWRAEEAARPDVDHQRRRARRLALSLVELGETDEAVERQLHRWGLHPALAHDALRWADERRRPTEPAGPTDATAVTPVSPVAPLSPVAPAELAPPPGSVRGR